MNDFSSQRKRKTLTIGIRTLFFYLCTLAVRYSQAYSPLRFSHVFYSTGDENLMFNVHSLFYLLIISRLLTTFIFILVSLRS